jgi:hypothetical protein
MEIIRRAVEAPDQTDRQQRRLDGSVVAQKVKESKGTNLGCNALTHEYGDLLKVGNGPIDVRQPRVNDKRVDEAGNRFHFAFDVTDNPDPA